MCVSVSVCLCVRACFFVFFLPLAGARASVVRRVCVFARLSRREAGWKGKVFKGQACVSTWVLLQCYSHQYSAVIPDLARQTTKASPLTLRKKPLFSS